MVRANKAKLLIVGLVLLTVGSCFFAYNSIRLSQQESYESNHAIFFMGLTPSQYSNNIYRLSMLQLFLFTSVELSSVLFFTVPLSIFCLGAIIVVISSVDYMINYALTKTMRRR